MSYKHTTNPQPLAEKSAVNFSGLRGASGIPVKMFKKEYVPCSVREPAQELLDLINSTTPRCRARADGMMRSIQPHVL